MKKFYNLILVFVLLFTGLAGFSQDITTKSEILTEQGKYSPDISGRLIGNIRADRSCEAPDSLEVQGTFDGIRLDWAGVDDNLWIHWDDGEYSGISIGNNAHVEFDAAARWVPEQLTDYEGDTLVQIAFFPSEASAFYKVKVWIGPVPSCIWEQIVFTPVIDQWNYVTLNYPIIIDSSEELWVGYYVDSPTGYPAGVDNGPAIDGYGNMFNFGGWQTLLQNNPELNYNWNIEAYIRGNMDGKLIKYAVYRSDAAGPYFLRDYSDQNYYLDDSVCQSTPLYHDYKVNALHITGNDTCESDFSNTVFEECVGIDENVESSLNIYPNPATDLIHVESPEILRFISVYDGCGHIILRKEVDRNTIDISVKDIEPGFYLIRLETDNKMINRKILIIH